MPNQSLQEVLPLLRPRSAEPTMFSQTVFYLLWIGLAALAILYFLRWLRIRKHRRQEFEDLAKNHGLKDNQIRLLKSVADHDRMKNPMRLITSDRFFDRHVGEYAIKIAGLNLNHPHLDDIGAIRAILGFDQLSSDKALLSTRLIAKHQTLMVKQESYDFERFTPWIVVECDEATIGLVPLLKDDTHHYDNLKIGDEVSVMFWRKGDTEYRFNTTIVAQDAETYTCFLSHSSTIDRLQQRDFYRIDVDFELSLCGLAVDQEENIAEPINSNQEQETVALKETADQISNEETTRIDRTNISATTSGLEENQLYNRNEPTNSEKAESITNPHSCIEDGPRINGRVTDISAGGFGLVVVSDYPHEITNWLTDPQFKGPFPLGGIVCQLIGEQKEGKTSTLKLKFVDLPPNVESAIVRAVYQHQLSKSLPDLEKPKQASSDDSS